MRATLELLDVLDQVRLFRVATGATWRIQIIAFALSLYNYAQDANIEDIQHVIVVAVVVDWQQFAITIRVADHELYVDQAMQTFQKLVKLIELGQRILVEAKPSEFRIVLKHRCKH
jgi:hypothetical protein